MKLDKLTVQGYKSIRNLENFELGNVNVLIGANGTGKSNFISLFRLLAALAKGNLQGYVAKQGGAIPLLFGGPKLTSQITADFSFGQNGYGFTIEPTIDHRVVFDHEEARVAGEWTVRDLGAGHSETRLPQSVGRNGISPDVPYALESWRVYHFHDTSDLAPIKQPHASNDNWRLKPDAENLAAYLAMIRRNNHIAYRRIVSTIRLAAPFFGDFFFRDSLPKTVELEWTERGDPDTPHRAHVLSDGTLRLICLTTLLLQPEHLIPDTVIIDEPELGLHPYAINLLAEMLKQVASTKQVVIATQSVELLNHFDPEDVIVVDRVNGASTFQRLNVSELSDWLEDYSVGELWNRNIFGGRPTREAITA